MSRPTPETLARAARALAILLVLGAIAWVLAPLFSNLAAWGGHDWDMVTSFRYLTVDSLLTYRQFPGWNPYACGGYTAWGYVESDTNLVSPFLPLYLLLDMRLALRLEVLGATLLAAFGAWALAGRFTKSPVARAFAAILFALCSRWTMQAAVGHAMHLYYAWLPWALFFFDRSVSDPDSPSELASRLRVRDSLLAAVFVALMVYTGAIYPLPHTLFLLGVYAALLSASRRTIAPLTSYLLAASIGLGLAAPKLLPIADAFSRRPRLTESTEVMGPRLLWDVLTSRTPLRPPQWGWHEWGLYIGWIPLLLLATGVLLARGPRLRALAATGVLLVIIACGAFHPLAPWTLLHKLNVFQSQHVPSRWLFPAVLLLAVVAAAWLGRLLETSRRPWAELLALVGLSAIAIDVGGVARGPLGQAFWMQLPPGLKRRTFELHQEARVPPSLRYVKPDWAPPTLPGMIAGTGILECWSVVPMSIFAKDATGRVPGQGARGRGDPQYRGEVFTEDGSGKAEIERWTPNEVTVRVTGAAPGDRLRLNQNFDPGWRAGGEPAENLADTPAIRLFGGDQRVVFRYVPVHFHLGLALFGGTLAVAIFLALRARRRARILGEHLSSRRSRA